jgi:phytoene synthase
MFREMCALDAFMRQTDDLCDDPRLDPEIRRQQLAEWREELAAALDGQYSASRLLPALADVALRREIPSEYLYEVIAGVAGDLAPRTFASFPELEHYCYQVAGVVGLCCLHIWGYRAEEPRDEALACGTAFQLTNILRDLGEDARAGRVYLPQDELAAVGYSSEDLAAGVRNDAFTRLLQQQLERAWTYYDRALPLRHRLHADGRRVFSAFFDLYSTLLEQIEKSPGEVLTRPVRLSRWKKGSVLLRCLLRLDAWLPPATPRPASELTPAHPR